MADIINLRRARKAQNRQTEEAAAAANRAKFGTPKALRDLAMARTKLDEKRLAAHRRDDDTTT